jgi:predicted SnoaL-like aldol condensation-catalyzing enzyme
MTKMLLGLALAAFVLAPPAARAADVRQMEENKKIVAAFYDAALQKDFEKASQYLGVRYIQHNPAAADGREGFKAFIAFLKDKFPNNRSEIKRIFATGIM